MYVRAPRPAGAGPAPAELQRLPSFAAHFGSGLCIYAGKGCAGKGLHQGEGKGRRRVFFPWDSRHSVCSPCKFEEGSPGDGLLSNAVLGQTGHRSSVSLNKDFSSPGRNRRYLLIKKDIISKK